MRMVLTFIINFCAMVLTPMEWPFYRRLSVSVLIGFTVLCIATIAFPKLAQ